MKIEVKNVLGFSPFSITITFATELEVRDFLNDLKTCDPVNSDGEPIELSDTSDELIEVLKNKLN